MLRIVIRGGIDMKNKIIPKAILISLLLTLVFSFTQAYADSYTVKSGDSLYLISIRYSVSIAAIKSLNNLTTDTIYPGQVLKLSPDYVNYTVKSGDTLWLLSQRYNTTISAIMKANSLTNYGLLVGQALLIPAPAATPTPVPTPAPTPTPTPTANKQLQPVATIFYTVLAGDTADSIAKKMGTSAANIMKYNYMLATDWFYAGQKIAINGYAVRTYTVTPGESTEAARIGKLVDWFTEGQYIIKRDDIFTITDVDTGISFKVKMLGGYNHCDVETLTAADTEIMYNLFQRSWQWTPRAVVIFKDGMNIAASLSGMPHDVESITDNNVKGHFDLYLQNSKPHGSDVSSNYVSQHYAMILKAAGQ